MTIKFPYNLNVSLQVGDTIFTCLTNNFQSGVNQPNTTLGDTKPFPIGIVIDVDLSTNTVIIDTSGFTAVILTTSHYLFFSKDPIVNTSGIIGYFAETEYRNYSSNKAEIFATAVDYVESSK